LASRSLCEEEGYAHALEALDGHRPWLTHTETLAWHARSLNEGAYRLLSDLSALAEITTPNRASIRLVAETFFRAQSQAGARARCHADLCDLRQDALAAASIRSTTWRAAIESLLEAGLVLEAWATRMARPDLVKRQVDAHIEPDAATVSIGWCTAFPNLQEPAISDWCVEQARLWFGASPSSAFTRKAVWGENFLSCWND
jgi:hypothetical protein